MDSLYREFGFDPKELKELLSNTGSFVAGGAAAHMLCEKDPKTFDGDLDIWYTNAPPRDAFAVDPPYGQYEIVKVNAFLYARPLLEKYIENHGYKVMNRDFELTQEYTNKENPLSKEILCVMPFEFGNKRVQIIYALGGPREILNSFDYSFCAVGCGADNKFFGNELEMTKEGKGYAMNPARTPGRDAKRREKYAKRGFTIV